eukprot:jgi/Mesvir1/8897/Mv02780-RA.1
MSSPREIVMRLTEATARHDDMTQASLIEQLRLLSERKRAEKRRQHQHQQQQQEEEVGQAHYTCYHLCSGQCEAAEKTVTFASCDRACGRRDDSKNSRDKLGRLTIGSAERGSSPAGTEECNDHQQDGSGGEDNDNSDEPYPKSPCSWFSSFASMDATHAPPAYYRDNMVGTVASMVEVAARAWSMSAGPKSHAARLAEELCDLIADMEAVLAGKPRQSPRDIQTRLYNATTALQVLCKTSAYPSPPLRVEERFYDMVRQRVAARRCGGNVEHFAVEHIPHG